MHVYLVRHADAVEGEDDAARPLSAKGRAQIRAVGGLLRGDERVVVAEVWHSPLVRARETADLLSRRLGLKAKLRKTTGLLSADDPKLMARRLAKQRRPVIVVGHDPHLSLLATLLVTGRPEPLRFRLKKCAVLRLDREAGDWIVRWLVSPEVV